MPESDDEFDPVKPGHISLSEARDVNRPEWPAELAKFYAQHEGVGLDSKGHHSVRMAKLSEVTKVGWTDLGLSPEPPHAGWASFSAYRIGFSDYGDAIVYVLTAPGVPEGAVLALGATELCGPAGQDEGGTQGALVLAQSLDDWIERMDRFGAGAHGMYADLDLPDWVSDVIDAEIVSLNPYSDRARFT